MTYLELDNSKRSTFIACPKKFYYDYIASLQKVTGNSALRYGTCFHAGMEAYYEHVRVNGWTRDGEALKASIMHAQKIWEEETALFTSFYEDYRNLHNLILALTSYFNHFAADEGFLEVVSPEKAFKILITDKKDDFSFYFTGKIDLKIRLNGSIWGNEFKTSGYTIKQQTERIQRSPQIIGYTYAIKETSDDLELPEGFLTTLHQITSRKKKDGEYGKLTIDFSRSPQVFSHEDVCHWRESILFTAKSLTECIEKDHFPKYYDSCYQYGRCTFMNLCEQNVSPGEEILEGYQKRIPWDVLKTVKEGAIIETKEKGNYS
jgi:hypothetical protein